MDLEPEEGEDGPCVGRGKSSREKDRSTQARYLAKARKKQGEGGILKALRKVDEGLPRRWYNTMRAWGGARKKRAGSGVRNSPCWKR